MIRATCDACLDGRHHRCGGMCACTSCALRPTAVVTPQPRPLVLPPRVPSARASFARHRKSADQRAREGDEIAQGLLKLLKALDERTSPSARLPRSQIG